MIRLVNSKLHDTIVAKWKVVDSRRPFPKEVVERLHGEFRTEYTYNTNAIEGNSLTLRETQLVIEEGLTIGGKSLREIEEARNHPEAIDYVEKLASEGNQLTDADIFTLHQIIMKGTMDPKFIGRYRHGEIRISGSKHIPPPAYEIAPQMNQLLYDLNNNPEEYTTVELAAMVLHKLVYIHPFQDGNGRIARLLTNLMLMKKRYPQIIIPRSDRSKYLNYLEKADQGNHRPIANFVGQYVLKHLDLFLRALEQKPADRMLTLEQAAKLTSYLPGYLRLLANKGLIMAVKEGRNWRVHESEIREYVKTHPKSSANAQSKKYPAA